MIAYKYCIIRFVPFIEVEEFANVGVIIKYGDNEFKYRLNTHNLSRVLDFFSIKRDSIVEFLRGFETELNYWTGYFQGNDRPIDHILESLSVPKSNLIQCSSIRFGVTELSANELEEMLYQKFVQPTPAQKRTREEELVKHVRTVLKELPEGKLFSKKYVGDNKHFTTSFPFVRFMDSRCDLIRPLDLGFDNPTKIIEHADMLAAKVRRVKESIKDMDVKVLIPYDLGNYGNLSNAVISNQKQVLEELNEIPSISLTKWNDAGSIKEFVQLH